LDGELRKLDAFPSKQDPCLYLKNKGEKLMIIHIYPYVDDILIISNDFKEVVCFRDNLSKAFDMKDLGNPKRCLGIDLKIDEEEIKQESLNQETYVHDILQCFGMEKSNPVSLLDINMKLIKTDP